MTIFSHTPHPHVLARRTRPPVTAAAVLENRASNKLNLWLATHVTAGVGTMWCAYVFTALTLVSLPSVLSSGSVIAIVAWVAQTFLQLVLLSVIMVGQNISSEAGDKRSQDTYDDVAALLHNDDQGEHHLQAQDELLERIVALLEARQAG